MTHCIRLAVLALLGVLPALLSAAEISIACGHNEAEHALCREAAEAWASASGHQARVIKPPEGVGDRLQVYQELLGIGVRSLDVMEIDVTWPGLLADELVDLTPYLDGAESQFAPALIANNRVDGRLVALPWFLDFGLLYYRKDLLDAQGIPVPQDWDQLEDAAIRLQDHQRESGNQRFWGFVWQGWPDEGLTCNALEWIASWGGGSIVEPDGRVSIGNPEAEHALGRPSGWLHILSPESVLSYTDRESLERFASGEAAFLRHWPGAWSVLEAEGSKVRGKVGVAPLPKGGPEGRHVGTLGGWQLAVSRHSPHPALAADLVRFLTSAEVQRQRALAATMVPTRPALFQDPAIAAALPFLGLLADGALELVARPSTVTGASYPQVSELLQQGLSRLLDGRESSEDMLTALVAALEGMSEGGLRW